MTIREKITVFKQKKFLRDVGYVYFSALINGASLFLVNVLLGRELSKEWYATFTLAALILSTVSEISDLGLNAGLLRFAPFYIANHEFDKLKQLVKTIWRWRVSMAAIFTIGGILFSYPISAYILGQKEIVNEVAISFLGVGGVILLGFIATYLQASQRFLRGAVMQSLKGLLRFVGIAALLIFHVHSIIAYIGVYIVVPWILVAFNYRVLPAGFRQSEIHPEIKQKMHSQLRRFSAWLTVWSVLSIISSRVDQIMISKLLGLEQVAIYTVAYQFIQLFPIISQSITAVIAPRFSSVQNKTDLGALLKRTTKWIAVPFVTLLVLVYPSQYLIILFFGHQYDASLPIYLVIAVSLIVNLLVIPFSQVLTAYNRTELMAYSGVLQFIINIVANIVLIPRYGVMGAAYTFALGILAALVYNGACSWYLIKKYEITPL